ncbi:hypothetical protein [Thiohalophilus sp.]|uniref:hypothetical protein n=1 Tax=Thiohalophilus sp. TaxID=3028392 RepID=UPI002ACDA02F|nr:hypothetical protein [Thiohalophilus sp.]MDZ7803437.1 hypothetical protein [Thiohalophilus sp.]
MTMLFRHILSFFILNALIIASPPAASATLSDTALARLAAKLAPGEFRKLNANLPDAFETYHDFLRHTFTSDCPDQWGEQGHWHRGRGQAFFLGDRTQSAQQRDPDDDDIVFVSYLAGENRWVHNSKTGVRDSNDHHPYSQMALDEKRDRYYRIKNDTAWVYDIGADTRKGYEGPQAWTRVNHVFPGGGNSPKEVHEALDRIVMADEDGNVYGINPDDFSDQILLGTRPGQNSYQSLMTYNRVRNELLWIGGTYSTTRQMVTLVDAQGNVVAKNDAPSEVVTNISKARIFYDPTTGNYLLLDDRGASTKGVLWEYSPSLDEWRVAVDFAQETTIEWPGNYCGHVMIPLDEYGVIMWMTRYGTRLYRHKSIFSGNEEPTSEPEPTPDPGPIPDPEPTPELSGEHPFYAITATMQPGEFRPVETTFPPGVGSMSRMNHTSWHPDDDSAGTFGVGWTDRTLFDPQTGRLFNVLMRSKYTRSITWLEPDLRWTGIMAPPEAGIGGRRPYNRLMDGGDGYMYFAPGDRIGRLTRAPYKNPAQWEDVGAPPLPMDYSGHAVGDYSTIWHPDIGKFVFYIFGRGPNEDVGIEAHEQGHVWIWGPGDDQWTRPDNHPDETASPGRTQSSGYGGTTLYNPVRREVLIYGGSANWSNPHPLGPQCMATINSEGEFRRHGPSGLPYSAKKERITFDPVTGDYIMTVGPEHRGDQTDLKMYVGDPIRGKDWELIHDWVGLTGADRPLHHYENWHRVTPLPGTDVLIWSDLRRGIVLQRLPATH